MNQKFRGFYVNYQPQVSGRTGEIIGAEALARFRDGEGNMISPAEFVPVMEAEGMIYGMGLWILRKSIQAAKKMDRPETGFFDKCKCFCPSADGGFLHTGCDPYS